MSVQKCTPKVTIEKREKKKEIRDKRKETRENCCTVGAAVTRARKLRDVEDAVPYKYGAEVVRA